MSLNKIFLFALIISLSFAFEIQEESLNQVKELTYNQKIQGLVDDPIIGDNIFYLDGIDWQVTCLKNNTQETITFQATVPGDLVSDLERNKLVQNPIFEDNFMAIAQYLNTNNFTYSKQFNLPAFTGGKQFIVFDGVKMGANIYLNGNFLGQVTDQFLRYEFEILAEYVVENSTQTLTVEFAVDILTSGRFMACTGGWDWAFYSYTQTPEGCYTFSRGIWKSVYVLQYSEIAITNVVPLTYYLGDYPTSLLADKKTGDFLLNITIFFNASQEVKGNLSFSSGWGLRENQSVVVQPGNTTQSFLFNVSGSDVALWWPNGMGAQNLYNIWIEFYSAQSNLTLFTSRRIGFRIFALVTGNDTDPNYIETSQSEEGTIGAHGMLFRVNGAAIWSRGANQIPMEEMEGKINATAYATMVKSAADAGFNTIRIWGGGIYAPQVFYDTCDELGIMVFHDIQYAQINHGPDVTSIQDAEHRYNVRRLSNHPSIILWDGCNECTVLMNTPTAIYANFVMTIVAQEDNSRSIMPSCPSLGWKTGVDKLYVRANGNKLTTPDNGFAFEIHGPYNHGTGFPAPNGNATLKTFDPIIPLVVDTTQGSLMGIDKENIFHSEFGSSVFSSFESMAPTLYSSHWGIHAGMPGDNCTLGEWNFICEGENPMSQRNYPCDNIILQYFGQQKEGFDTVGKQVFQKQLFFCILGQALYIKGRIEQYRNQNQFGTIVWQYNEIWPTGGWGSIEYGTPSQGQVVGGRWKPLHYMYKRQLYTDVIATCGSKGQCYFRSDSVLPFKGEVVVLSINLVNATHKVLKVLNVDVQNGPGKLQFFELANFTSINAQTEVLQVQVFDEKSNTVCDNLNLLDIPANLQLQPANVTFTVEDEANYDHTVNIFINTDEVALFVTFTTLAQGRFSDNAFLMTPQDDQKIIQFIPFGPLDMNLLKNTLRVEHVNMYLASSQKVITKEK